MPPGRAAVVVACPGACLGGDATIVGASANVVVASMAARAGHADAFRAFLRHGPGVAAVSLAMSTISRSFRHLA